MGAGRFSQKHQIIAAGGGLLAYFLATNPQLRQTLGGMIPGMPQNKIAPDILKEYSKPPSMEDPFASELGNNEPQERTNKAG